MLTAIQLLEKLSSNTYIPRKPTLATVVSIMSSQELHMADLRITIVRDKESMQRDTKTPKMT